MRDMLGNLVEATGATNRGEVLRRSISIYNLLVEAKNEGKTIEIVGADGRERLIID